MDFPDPSGPSRTTKSPRAHPSVMMLLVAPFSMPSLICWFTRAISFSKLDAGHDVRLPDRADLEIADGGLVGLRGRLVGHLPLGDRLVHLPRERLDLLELG